MLFVQSVVALIGIAIVAILATSAVGWARGRPVEINLSMTPGHLLLLVSVFLVASACLVLMYRSLIETT